MTDNQFDLLMSAMGEMKAEFNDLKTEVSGVKAEVSDLKTEVNGVKAEVSDLKTEMNGVKAEVSDLKAEMNVRFDEVDSRFDDVVEQQKEHTQLITALINGQAVIELKIDDVNSRQNTVEKVTAQNWAAIIDLKEKAKAI